MDRRGLETIRLLVQVELKKHGVGVAAISGKNITRGDLTLTIDGHRYWVNHDVFLKCDIERIANRVKKAHFIAQN